MNRRLEPSRNGCHRNKLMLQTLLVELFDHLCGKLDRLQRLRDQQAMMITQAVSFTGFHNQVNLNFPAQGSAAVSTKGCGPGALARSRSRFRMARCSCPRKDGSGAASFRSWRPAFPAPDWCTISS